MTHAALVAVGIGQLFTYRWSVRGPGFRTVEQVPIEEVGMERRTIIAVAGGVTLTVVGVLAAVGLNFGLLHQKTPTTGPGTFDPVAATPIGRDVSTLSVTPTFDDPAGATSGSSSEPTPAPEPSLAPGSTAAGEPGATVDDHDKSGHDDDHSGHDDHDRSGRDDDD